MTKDTVVTFKKPAEFEDELTELLRRGARHLLMQAVEVELEQFLAKYDHLRDSRGRRVVVRNGYLPERKIMTGLGPVEIRVARTRDRGQGTGAARVLFFDLLFCLPISSAPRVWRMYCPGCI